MAVAIADDDNMLGAACADEMGFLVALLRDLLDESYGRQSAELVAATQERWALCG
jgi:hypothetical protein